MARRLLSILPINTLHTVVKLARTLEASVLSPKAENLTIRASYIIHILIFLYFISVFYARNSHVLRLYMIKSSVTKYDSLKLTLIRYWHEFLLPVENDTVSFLKSLRH